jgi:hypothetical protein
MTDIDGVLRDQLDDLDFFLLALRGFSWAQVRVDLTHYAIRSVRRLPIIVRVKVLVIDDDDGCSGEIDPEMDEPMNLNEELYLPDASRLGGQEEDRDIRIIVELIDQTLSLVGPRPSVEPGISHTQVIERHLQDVKDHDELLDVSIAGNPFGRHTWENRSIRLPSA